MRIHELQNGHEDHIGYWAEGHQDAYRFVGAIEDHELERQGIAEERKKEMVEHFFASASPVDPEAPDSDQGLFFHDEPGEGREAVTVIFDDGRARAFVLGRGKGGRA